MNDFYSLFQTKSKPTRTATPKPCSKENKGVKICLGILFSTKFNTNPKRNFHINGINETSSEKFSNIKQQT